MIAFFIDLPWIVEAQTTLGRLLCALDPSPVRYADIMQNEKIKDRSLNSFSGISGELKNDVDMARPWSQGTQASGRRTPTPKSRRNLREMYAESQILF
jgi:hypothetical protein